MNYTFVVMETFGQWLKRHRKNLGLEQKDIAARAGVSISYVSTLERQQPHSLTGKKITPDREKVSALAKAVKGDENEALGFFRYAPENNLTPAIPKPILDAIARAGTLSERDTIYLAGLIDIMAENSDVGDYHPVEMVKVPHLGEVGANDEMLPQTSRRPGKLPKKPKP